MSLILVAIFLAVVSGTVAKVFHAARQDSFFVLIGLGLSFLTALTAALIDPVHVEKSIPKQIAGFDIFIWALAAAPFWRF